MSYPSRCVKCRPLIDHLNSEIKDFRVKWSNLKFEREDLIKRNSVLKIEVSSLEAQVKELRAEVQGYRPDLAEYYPPVYFHGSFSEESEPSQNFRNTKKKKKATNSFSHRYKFSR